MTDSVGSFHIFMFSKIAQAILEMRALWLVKNDVISRYNNPARGDYYIEELLSKWPPRDFLMFLKMKQVKWKKMQLLW